MKTILFILLSLNVMAQNENSGVYLTFNDYVNNKLSYEINCKTEKHKIRMNEFLNKSYITVIHNGLKHQLDKDSIYGFISCDEPLIRFQNKDHYYLTEKGLVWIFYRNESKTNGKIITVVKKYYFAAKGDGKMQDLSKANLMKAFPDNHKFHDMLDAEFKNETDIAAYDSFHKMYKVNHLLEQASK
ncbi:MAG TPA: hypothetical protein VJY62_12045 [Bacteroidia bacterium]|nr:hypothetical protein [Bacteroidia bacterium]